MKVARVLVNFIDGSFLYVELSKKMESTDTILSCERVVGLPEGSPMDKPTIAVNLMRLSQAGEPMEFIIPMARVNGVSILEEFLAKQVASDIQELWKVGEPGKRAPGAGGVRK